MITGVGQETELLVPTAHQKNLITSSINARWTSQLQNGVVLAETFEKLDLKVLELKVLTKYRKLILIAVGVLVVQSPT